MLKQKVHNKIKMVQNILNLAGNFKQILKPKIKEMASIYMKVPIVFASNKEKKINLKETNYLQKKTKNFNQKLPYEPIFPEVLKTPQKKITNEILVLILNIFQIISYFSI